jgi:hypothetical protein
MRSIPSKEMLRRMLSSTIRKDLSFPGRIPSDEFVALKISQLRKLLLAWRDRQLKTRAMLEQADKILDGSGVEYIRSDDDDQHGAHGAYYVNKGETYEPTILLDLDRGRVWATSWGDWVEAEERAGRRFE